MKKHNNLAEPPIPRYAIPWLAVGVVLHFGIYSGCKWLADGWYHYDLTTAWDRQIPFVPAFILIYFFTFAFWIINYILIVRESKEHCRKIITGEIIAKLLCIPFFLLLPTTMVRGTVTGSGYFDRFVRFIYAMDTPSNLFPSIHCLDGWLCWRGLVGCKKVPRWYKTFSFVFAILICASTLLVKQHVLVDIPGGILMAEIGMLCSRLIESHREKRGYQ